MRQEDSTTTGTGQLPSQPDPASLGDLRALIREYWERHYHHDTSPTQPSPFAVDIAASLDVPSLVLDLGCGNGRDSLYFAESGHQVIAVDGSFEAIEHLRHRASSQSEDRLVAHAADLADPGVYEHLGNLIQAQRDTITRLIVYARFLLHAVPLTCQDLLVAKMTTQLAPGDQMHLEYRTGDLEAVEYEFGNTHYRRSVDPQSVEEVARRAGVSIARSEISGEFAPLGSERPLCARTYLQR